MVSEIRDKDVNALVQNISTPTRVCRLNINITFVNEKEKVCILFKYSCKYYI